VALLKTLESTLDAKAKTYAATKGPAASIFLLNNFHYIMSSLRDSELGSEVCFFPTRYLSLFYRAWC
jgi:hypothetical protein